MPAARLLVAATVLLALTVAAPAAADDASVKRAYDSENRAFKKLEKSLEREMARWDRRGFTRAGKLRRMLRRSERLSRTVADRLSAEQASSPTGEKARDLAIKAWNTTARFFVVARHATRAAAAGRIRKMRRHLRRMTRLQRRAARQGKRAEKLFEQLGLA